MDLHRDTGADPPDYVRPIWDDYLAFHATRDEDRAHQQLHQSHYAYLEPDEARFVTPEIIRNFCLAGQPDDIIQRLHELEADGLTGVNFALPTDTTRELVEQFANQVLNRYPHGTPPKSTEREAGDVSRNKHPRTPPSG